MSIPLDRLYNFLSDICNRNDLIIYGFFPYGSRKLEDIKMLQDIQNKDWMAKDWVARMTVPSLIFHDQEPLCFDLYTEEKIKDYVDTHFRYSESQNEKHLIANLHLRVCISRPLGVYDQVLLCHSEKHSKDLDLYQHNGFIGVYYWSHALIARDWFRFAKLDPMLIPNFDNIVHDFLIYSRAWSGTREYRLTLAEMLADNNLISCCETSFSEFDQQSHYTKHTFANPDLAINRNDLHKIYRANTHDSSSSADYNSQDYRLCAIEVVLETLFDDSRHHLTEKILRPIACGRPFMLASTAGSLQYLRQYGFQTFHGLIDESYDLITDPHMRLTAIVQEMKRINDLDYKPKRLLWTELYKIAEHNKKLFFSVDWQNNIIKEFKQNFESAMSQLTATGKYQKEMERLALLDPIIAHNRSTDSAEPGGPTVESRQKLAQWLKTKNPLT
jgi:hypothetical protein